MRSFLVSATAALLALAADHSRADDFAIDSSHTSVIFGVKHMEYSYTYGRFNKVTGSFSIDPADAANNKFELTIDAASVDTNDAKRDEHLRGPDFFNTGQFPVLTFKSTKVEIDAADPSKWKVTGDLTIHGTTRPVTLDVQKVGEGPGMAQDFRTGFWCQSKIMRSEFGMTNMIPMIGDEIAVTVSFEGSRK